MVFSVFQFLITSLLAVFCVNSLSVSTSDVPVLALLIPALWLLPQGGIAGLMLLGSMLVYGLTLPSQPVALSIAVWTLLPVLMVVFSRRSNIWIVTIVGVIVSTLSLGILFTQASGGMGGSAIMSLVQGAAVCTAWYAVSHWRTRENRKGVRYHSWWALLLVIPMWIAGWATASAISLCLIGILAMVENLTRLKNLRWNKLLCWTLPTVGFAALVVNPAIDVPQPVFVVWLCLLGTAWMTDYILQVEAQTQD
ncbi:hypothetical protein [Vibrio hippocampi]|uniref:Integral membrane protein n=1 Tax=Vibrio hippocampi TaxID=654686 RepID=A0ABN8DE36_9VIBR|nr:hypothetical protein [Vibrio hippocampi]CAH0525302.1 hypothetical protein VHP8226_00906 [Vibrio hippocampi]